MTEFEEMFPVQRSYRPGEVANQLGIHIDTVRNMTKDGRLDCFRVGGQRRFSYGALQRFASANFSLVMNKIR